MLTAAAVSSDPAGTVLLEPKGQLMEEAVEKTMVLFGEGPCCQEQRLLFRNRPEQWAGLAQWAEKAQCLLRKHKDPSSNP